MLNVLQRHISVYRGWHTPNKTHWHSNLRSQIQQGSQDQLQLKVFISSFLFSIRAPKGQAFNTNTERFTDKDI